jgi:hypothetical protein
MEWKVLDDSGCLKIAVIKRWRRHYADYERLARLATAPDPEAPLSPQRGTELLQFVTQRKEGLKTTLLDLQGGHERKVSARAKDMCWPYRLRIYWDDQNNARG